MGDTIEVIFTSGSDGILFNSAVWDPRTGTALMNYKGGNSATAKTLALLGNDFVMAANREKPLLHVWSLNSGEQVQNIRFVTPGLVSALAVSADANYCIAAISEKIHVWQISSGRLLGVVSRHFQPVTCLRFLDSGCHFLSGGQDGMLLAWPLAKVIALYGRRDFTQSVAGQVDPRYSFSDHVLPITDIHVGKGGIRSRVLSVSLDRTCKIYDFASGKVLLSIVFDVRLMAVTMNLVETSVFVGGENGCIYQFNISDPPRMREYHIEKEDKNLAFLGHTEKITVLSLSMDGETLLSGSDDERVIIWNIPSQTQIRVIPHKGAITNAFFALSPRNIFVDNVKPNIILHTLQRSTELVEGANKLIEVLNTDYNHSDSEDDLTFSDQFGHTNDETSNEHLQNQIDQLKRVNLELYKAALGKIIDSSPVKIKKAVINSTPLTPAKKHKKKAKLNKTAQLTKHN